MKLLPASLYDVPAQQAWLEDQAAKGYFLTQYGSFSASFVRGQPHAFRYRLTPMPRKEKRPDPEQQELCSALGWQYITTAGISFHVWRSDDPAAPEPDTDPQVQAEAYDGLLRRLRRTDLGLAVYCLALLCILLVVYLGLGLGLENHLRSWQPWYEILPTLLLLLFLMARMICWERSLRRYVRTLKAGVPMPSRRPYQRLTQLWAMVLAVLCGAQLAAYAAQLTHPKSESFLPVSDFDQPVPYVSLAETEVLALPRNNWHTREQWWTVQDIDERGRAEGHYYEFHTAWMASRLIKELGGEPVAAPGLDGAWWSRNEERDYQELAVRLGRRVATVVYRGPKDLRELVPEFAALLAEKEAA